MTRETNIQTESLIVIECENTKDPHFYAAKQEMRSALGNPLLIEILPNKITVVDFDMSVHVTR